MELNRQSGEPCREPVGRMAASARKPASVAASLPIPILSYHNIASPPRGATHRGLYLQPEKFRTQMRTLQRLGYRGVSMNKGLPYLRGEKQGKVAILTFDDGYRDNLEHALPALREHGFTATCYLVSDFIGTYNQWDAELLRVKKPLMDVAAVRQWLDAGMQIGSHTRSHPHLPRLTRAEKQREIAGSKFQLERLLGRSVEHLCFPFGEYDQDCLQAASACGYVTAVTTERGRVRRGDDLLALPRVGNSGRRGLLRFVGRTLLWNL